jgi:hypothetical protein
VNAETDVMIREFRNVMKDEDFVNEIDMSNPGNIFAMAVYSVSKTIHSKLEKTITDR